MSNSYAFKIAMNSLIFSNLKINATTNPVVSKMPNETIQFEIFTDFSKNPEPTNNIIVPNNPITTRLSTFNFSNLMAKNKYKMAVKP